MRVSAGNRHRAERGFTLVEVLISILLCVVAVIGIMGLYRVQTKSSSFSRHTTEATALAEDKLEQMRTLQGAATAGTQSNLDEHGVVGTGLYKRTWSIVPQLPFLLGVVTCTVSWNEEGNTEQVSAVGQW
jgi:Tfp pilus assembly protein PilV|nr:prepilin-type N-terminal cleavage/methylation domain-containing protein [Kofleriaceae bacterium]